LEGWRWFEGAGWRGPWGVHTVHQSLRVFISTAAVVLPCRVSGAQRVCRGHGNCWTHVSFAICLRPMAHTNPHPHSLTEQSITPLVPPSLHPVLPPPARLFWSDDERFLKQFKSGNLKTKFKSYSKFPPCLKDMAFWVSPEFTENNLCELVRGTNRHSATTGCAADCAPFWASGMICD
jgi:hypothetical protein